MKITVDITDLGPNLSESTMQSQFERNISERFNGWKKAYGLKSGVSLKKEAIKLGTFFDRSLRTFVAGLSCWPKNLSNLII